MRILEFQYRHRLSYTRRIHSIEFAERDVAAHIDADIPGDKTRSSVLCDIARREKLHGRKTGRVGRESSGEVDVSRIRPVPPADSQRVGSNLQEFQITDPQHPAAPRSCAEFDV